MFFSKFFKKKKPETSPAPVIANLPALNAWGIFFQGNGMTLYNRNAATTRGANDSAFMYLKSYPEVFELERKLYANWFTTTRTAIYLQQWDAATASWSLVCITFLEPELKIIQSQLTTSNWVSGYENGQPVVFINGETALILD